MNEGVDPYLRESDLLVLRNLLRDIELSSRPGGTDQAQGNDLFLEHDDGITIKNLAALKDEPVLFCTWDYKDLPFSKQLPGLLLSRYNRLAQTIVRHRVDVVFLTHIILYMSTSLPSALWLFYDFSWIHGILHVIMQVYYMGSFTLLLHNCIHHNGLLAPRYRTIDRIWPYILKPLMGHTWNSYYYHHVKHHHVENNGPDDLSSTIRYQRDSFKHFCLYVGRFLLFIWIELPLYFLRKGKTDLAIKSFLWETSSITLIYLLAQLNFNAALCTLILPFCLTRIGLMVGNFGQHALVDDIDPKSDFRSSITLIDVPSNRFCFNDGWHTSHHLNPLRHWRDHPAAFMKSKKSYLEGKALFFRNIDYLMMTYRILRKDYLYLADCMIPIGDQINLTRQERADLLRSKTKRFTEEEIRLKFYGDGNGGTVH
ncbi:MAG: hypothetical protein GOMPHAMPRED_002612 [Gomphillus americanus]|uniref:Fatty acid desaturase domain-containing protein n=1 Tax=Gomphillus americanus TaxID=1940652 RepID=A0A8H3FDS3_9LECA|nr:MAG: hypothetical protein GOMPHAMPRED_002612 [Gomphillus americanus]